MRLWDCFKNCDARVSGFYKRSVGLLVSCKTIQNFENILQSIIVVATSASYTDDCKKNHFKLAELIKTHNIDDFFWDNKNLASETSQQSFVLEESKI